MSGISKVLTCPPGFCFVHQEHVSLLAADEFPGTCYVFIMALQTYKGAPYIHGPRIEILGLDLLLIRCCLQTSHFFLSFHKLFSYPTTQLHRKCPFHASFLELKKTNSHITEYQKLTTFQRESFRITRISILQDVIKGWDCQEKSKISLKTFFFLNHIWCLIFPSSDSLSNSIYHSPVLHFQIYSLEASASVYLGI